MKIVIVFICLIIVAVFAQVDPDLPSCTHPIYCNNEILDTFQTQQLFPDQKSFVDRPLSTKSVEDFLTQFKALPDHKKETLHAFLEANTYDTGYEVESVVPADFTEMASFLQKISPHYRGMAQVLHAKWPHLARSFNMDKVCKDCSSAIPVPHPFIVAGGRFIEGYFWDTLWITQGVLTSGMSQTALGMIRNFLHLINTYGFVPNGFRQYYLTRSQPPITAVMVMMYYQETKDVELLVEALPTLVKEYEFWMKHKAVTLPGRTEGSTVTLNRYIANTQSPRPESYLHDKVIGDGLENDEQRGYFYQAIATAAESGWDFSSRFLEDRYSLATSRTHDIIPVDLNSILHKTELTIAHIASILGDLKLSKQFFDLSVKRRDAIHQYLWNEKKQMWFDCLSDGKPLYTKDNDPAFFASNLFPIWSEADHFTTKAQSHAWIASVVEKHIDVAGFPTSTIPTTQQWDGDKGWAPLHWIITEGLEISTPSGAKPHPILLTLVNRWVSSNYCAWKKYDVFFEKYHTARHGEPASGGEYTVQDGFGWTNGVLLHYLTKYGFQLTPPQCVNAD